MGIDLRFSSVSASAQFLRTGEVTYERRVRGRHFAGVRTSYIPPQNALFLVADALDPPFSADSFDCVAALNLLDNVRVPLVLIGQMDALLRPRGTLLLSTPYEWSADISDAEEWIETEDLDARAMVRQILEGGMFPPMQLHYHVEQDLAAVPWLLRHHDRRYSLFFSHLLKARKHARGKGNLG